MELSEFKLSIIEQIKFDAVAEITSEKEEFLNYSTSALIDAEEIEEFNFLPFEGIGRKGKKIQIDGYSYSELDSCLNIFVSPPLTYFDAETLVNSDVERFFARARNFIEDADFIERNAEESSPGYGLAIDINKKYKDVRKYSIYLMTDMVMSKSIKNLKETELFGKAVEYNIWDIMRLYQLAESKTGKEDIVINIRDFQSKGIPCLPASKTKDYTAYLCNIPGMVLATLYNKYGSRLLEGNVRSFLQTKGKVNKGIRSTILNNPAMFFAYNNGIAATAYDIKIEEKDGISYITEITSLQIVNGGQTTASLAMALLNDKRDGAEQKIRDIYVPMKLSIVSPEGAQELIPNISRYANSQNKVSDADLWSNHPFHVRLEEMSRRIVAPAIGGMQYGTHWYYERARGQYKQEMYKLTPAEKNRFEMKSPKNQMFNKTDLAKFMNILLLRPDIASHGGQKSFTKFAEWASVQWEKSETEINDEFFRRIVALAILFRQTDRIVKKLGYNSYKINIVAYSISKILHAVNTAYPSRVISYKNIWLKQSLSQAWINQIELVSKDMYQHLVSDTRLVENVTEWAKRDACWTQAKEIKATLLPEFVAELVLRSEEVEEKKVAKKDQQLTNKVNVMVEVANFGVENWKDLVKWGTERNILNAIEVDFVKLAIAMERGKFPTEKQCARIMDILDKARTESFPK